MPTAFDARTGIARTPPVAAGGGTIDGVGDAPGPWDAILFDWDGTLCDSLDEVFSANRAVMAALGLPFDDDRYRRHFAADWRTMYRDLGVPDDRLEEAGGRWVREYDGGRAVTLFPGVLEALRRLRTAGLRIGLVTAGHRDIVLPQLERLGVGPLFAATVFGDDPPRLKPSPAALRLAIGRLGLAGRPVVAYLGDTPDDMRMARAAGARAVGIVSRVSDADVLYTAGAHEVVGSATVWLDRQLDLGVLPSPPAGAG